MRITEQKWIEHEMSMPDFMSTVTQEGRPFTFKHLSFGTENGKVIGRVECSSHDGGFPHIDNVNDLEDAFNLVVNAPELLSLARGVVASASEFEDGVMISKESFSALKENLARMGW